MSAGETLFEIDPPLATLTFNRPQARNALTWAMYDALVAACDRVDEDAAIRVLILAGAGGQAFAAGTDISQFRAFTGASDARAYEQKISAVLTRLERVSKPTIARIEGVAAGGGCAIATACDLRIATPESSLGVPIARTLGNCLATGTLARIVDLIGPARAKELLFTGRLVPADEAAAWGLVNQVVAKERIATEVDALARGIAANAPLTILATKEMVRRIQAARQPADEAANLVEMCYTSDDFREGVSAFLEKRKPVWTGR
jgi:enoyl-CoA hydratase/carnithine racemase